MPLNILLIDRRIRAGQKGQRQRRMFRTAELPLAHVSTHRPTSCTPSAHPHCCRLLFNNAQFSGKSALKKQHIQILLQWSSKYVIEAESVYLQKRTILVLFRCTALSCSASLSSANLFSLPLSPILPLTTCPVAVDSFFLSLIKHASNCAKLYRAAT